MLRHEASLKLPLFFCDQRRLYGGIGMSLVRLVFIVTDQIRNKKEKIRNKKVGSFQSNIAWHFTPEVCHTEARSISYTVIVFCDRSIRNTKEKIKLRKFGSLIFGEIRLFNPKNRITNAEVTVAQKLPPSCLAGTGRNRSCLDFLFLLYQDKRK